MEKPTLMDDLGYPPFDFCLFCVVFCLAGGAAGLVGGFTECWMLGCSTIPCQPGSHGSLKTGEQIWVLLFCKIHKCECDANLNPSNLVSLELSLI